MILLFPPETGVMVMLVPILSFRAGTWEMMPMSFPWR
jgi:hypothetical protein